MTPLRRRASGRRLPGPLIATLPAVAVLCAAGCSGGGSAAHVAVPRPPAGQVKVCAALHKRLPDKVGGQSRRDPRPSSGLTAGWGSGDASIVLRCGVPRPKAMDDPQAAAVDANGVSWMVQPYAKGQRFTTTYRAAYVEVTMGSKFAHDGTPIAQLAKAVSKTDPSTV
ncbi:DUF3515 domain-containing protein [Streptomyces bomunensis]|uniref:DUF3515 domain-containing protein n=1 Tax=Streptomyces montanisoli TaxID=2798581 RepID=A0A940MLH0_9ACTN|nr:DUF3515 domain-containing protein [Streptomyces montanisoli]MBP0460638.1 DUF3515 domain-containing protein [Streptomyces montanisoli]